MASPNGRATEPVFIAASDVLPVRVENIPEELKAYHQWVAWWLEERDGRLTKIPIDAATGQRASVRDSRTWATFDEALAAYEDGERCHGLGFVFSSGDPFFGLDLDGVVDLATGALDRTAAKVVAVARESGCYVERSPSGKGLHVIGKGTIEPFNRNGREAYCAGRFFTVTGVVL
jgi:putative DNA primase/helicase